MEYKRMLFDAEGVSLGCTVGAGLWPAFQLHDGDLEGLLASLLIHLWEQEMWAFCSWIVADCICFVREGFFVCFAVKQC